MEQDKFNISTYQGENLLQVNVLAPKGFGIGTELIIDSLKAAIEIVTREADEWIAANPSPAITE